MDGLSTYIYDAENRLIQATTPQGNLAYRYDEVVIRTAEIVNGVTTRHLVDSNRDYAQVLEEIDANDQLIASYLHGDDLISMERINPDVPGTFAYHFYHYDGHGSVTGLSDETETLTDTYAYEAWGTVLARTGTTENRHQYTGEQYDPNLSFTYLRARYLQPNPRPLPHPRHLARQPLRPHHPTQIPIRQRQPRHDAGSQWKMDIKGNFCCA